MFNNTSFKSCETEWQDHHYQPVVFLFPTNGADQPLLQYGTVPDDFKDIIVQRVTAPTLPPLPSKLE